MFGVGTMAYVGQQVPMVARLPEVLTAPVQPAQGRVSLSALGGPLSHKANRITSAASTTVSMFNRKCSALK